MEIRTPESIAIRYELAGLGSRYLAVLIDLAVQVAIMIALAIIYSLARVRDVGIVRVLHVSARVADSLAIALAVLVSFAVFFGYFIIAEWRFGGRTVGKRAIGIRVVRDGGYPLDALSSVIRNMVRVVEAALGFYLVSAIVMIVSKENKRLGDFAAGTIVVRDVRFDARAIAPGTNGPAIYEFEPSMRAAIERYVDRRGMLSGAARARVAAGLAGTIRPHLGDSTLASLDDDALLLRLATREM